MSRICPVQLDILRGLFVGIEELCGVTKDVE